MTGPSSELHRAAEGSTVLNIDIPLVHLFLSTKLSAGDVDGEALAAVDLNVEHPVGIKGSGYAVSGENEHCEIFPLHFRLFNGGTNSWYQNEVIRKQNG